MDYIQFHELYHSGVKGMKWGVRRYTNEDGTLTEAGKARYNTDGSPKNAKDMSDEDLKRSNARLQAEQQYNNLSGRGYRNQSSATDKLIKVGASAVGSFLVVGGGMMLKELAKGNQLNKVSIGKALAAGGIAAFGGGVGSLVTSYGGTVNKEKTK